LLVNGFDATPRGRGWHRDLPRNRVRLPTQRRGARRVYAFIVSEGTGSGRVIGDPRLRRRGPHAPGVADRGRAPLPLRLHTHETNSVMDPTRSD